MIAKAFECDILFFKNFKSSWQRGTNENTHRVSCQYLLKESDFDIHLKFYVTHTMKSLNNIPQKVWIFLLTIDYFLHKRVAPNCSNSFATV